MLFAKLQECRMHATIICDPMHLAMHLAHLSEKRHDTIVWLVVVEVPLMHRSKRLESSCGITLRVVDLPWTRLKSFSNNKAPKEATLRSSKSEISSVTRRVCLVHSFTIIMLQTVTERKMFLINTLLRKAISSKLNIPSDWICMYVCMCKRVHVNYMLYCM